MDAVQTDATQKTEEIKPFYSEDFAALLKDLEDGKVDSISPKLLAREDEFNSLIDSLKSTTPESSKEYFLPVLKNLILSGKTDVAKSLADKLQFSSDEWDKFSKDIQDESRQKLTQYIVNSAPKKE